MTDSVRMFLVFHGFTAALRPHYLQPRSNGLQGNQGRWHLFPPHRRLLSSGSIEKLINYSTKTLFMPLKLIIIFSGRPNQRLFYRTPRA